ncbi:hypothetical protein M378DRAFT_585521 [Amanita muscaria Koide BX008]|uniref:Uncharacterized protein n=1 Tax=Amanita muscaria (strain Koide BX008) TaxID=946122 RepID=A0A0C2TC56_AMAMK|nr:hypothetical protein M378DRAFT_585521 [Amanita muscaria Koide BX008]
MAASRRLRSKLNYSSYSSVISRRVLYGMLFNTTVLNESDQHQHDAPAESISLHNLSFRQTAASGYEYKYGSND